MAPVLPRAALTHDCDAGTNAVCAVLGSGANETTSAAVAVLQIPPMFSAIKMKGVKLYDMAREGLSVER